MPKNAQNRAKISKSAKNCAKKANYFKKNEWQTQKLAQLWKISTGCASAASIFFCLWWPRWPRWTRWRDDQGDLDDRDDHDYQGDQYNKGGIMSKGRKKTMFKFGHFWNSSSGKLELLFHFNFLHFIFFCGGGYFDYFVIFWFYGFALIFWVFYIFIFLLIESVKK